MKWGKISPVAFSYLRALRQSYRATRAATLLPSLLRRGQRDPAITIINHNLTYRNSQVRCVGTYTKNYISFIVIYLG